MTEEKKRRGFAAMDPDKRREIARKGGAALKPYQRSFSQNPELAASAGAAGGTESHRRRREAKKVS